MSEDFEDRLLNLRQDQCRRSHPDYDGIANEIRQHLINLMSSVEQTDMQDLLGGALEGFDAARAKQIHGFPPERR
jgi:hypothetical protein